MRSIYMSCWGVGRLFPRPGGHQARLVVIRTEQPAADVDVLGRLRRAVGQVLRDLWAGQVQMGRALAGVPQPLVGPPPGHPERLVHNAALDAEEWMLWADILDRTPSG
ncbi:DUF6059 family protein [Streptomyces sp. NPDC087263]|uniref:DUF6059 family protein n=1 Tax=Streptomyces sp. NPDC087263 TaxID=3365773 RepID=UPI0037F6F977